MAKYWSGIFLSAYWNVSILIHGCIKHYTKNTRMCPKESNKGPENARNHDLGVANLFA